MINIDKLANINKQCVITENCNGEDCVVAYFNKLKKKDVIIYVSQRLL